MRVLNTILIAPLSGRAIAMKKSTRATLLAGILAALPLWSQSAGRIEPHGGTWKTWVLYNGSQLRLPPPPDLAASVK